MSHNKLFFCFEQYGICGNLLLWLKHFFTGRTHKTRVGVALSPLVQLLSGVVQGSGIGPVAFVIFIDGLAKLLESHGIKRKIFADDVKIYLSMQNANCAAMLQVALNTISDWAREWQLSISIH